jgi:hypothetical protein
VSVKAISADKRTVNVDTKVSTSKREKIKNQRKVRASRESQLVIARHFISVSALISESISLESESDAIT